MAIVYLCIGGNLGQREIMLAETCRMLNKEAGKIIHTSSVYESEAWGFSSHHTFYNQVVVLQTGRSAQDLLPIIHRIESSLGRERKGEHGYASRTMDIDILFFNREIIIEEGLEIPHPRLALRRFVLFPLLEINPAFTDPRSGMTIWQLLRACSDRGKIRKAMTDHWL